MTVKELKEACEFQIEIGNGDKHIAISRDDEGNGYHQLFYSFLSDPKEVRAEIESTGSERMIGYPIEDLVILG